MEQYSKAPNCKDAFISRLCRQSTVAESTQYSTCLDALGAIRWGWGRWLPWNWNEAQGLLRGDWYQLLRANHFPHEAMSARGREVSGANHYLLERSPKQKARTE